MASSERQDNDRNNPWWGEHVHRYMEASRWLTGSCKVMDIACGTGFGSALLAEKAKEVTGCDISEEAIHYSNKNFKLHNLRFHVEDGTKLSFPDHVFDVITSFETIEHTVHYNEMLKEFKRVLKPDGKLILSTPNFPVNSPTGKVTNPYHTQEFTYDELNALLKKHFNHVLIFGQKYIRYNKLEGWRKPVGQAMEWLFYKRGFRKLPLSVQDFFMRKLTNRKMYPQQDDYEMTTLQNEILACKTFYAICNN